MALHKLTMQSPVLKEFTLEADYQALAEIAIAIDNLFDQIVSPFDLEQTIYGIKLAVHEICNNMIEHAYREKPGTIQIRLTVDPISQLFVAALCDKGRAFDPSTATSPNLDEPQDEGYGLFLAEQLMDEVRYRRQGQENHWQLIKQLNPIL